MKIFIDSNVFLRLLVPEDETSYNQCQQIFNQISAGQIAPYCSNIVLLEVVYTLNRTYKFPKAKILSWLNDCQKLRNITIIDKTNFKTSVDLFNNFNIKFGDCLIAPQIPKSVSICTYDPDFNMIPGLIAKTPSQILNG